ncbi:hypothetical protein CEPID_08340 [Corynebacterium epidermidicanis]|uniref:Uncharacterized protein n=1 Tax=Corynebacterium epidermidicanis TaxID=1050174 RepID=A0A0G3GVE2_9CORY|nr:hypothetical protein CEPID_08340 [Corynebacterium epidermidicanis]
MPGDHIWLGWGSSVHVKTLNLKFRVPTRRKNVPQNPMTFAHDGSSLKMLGASKKNAMFFKYGGGHEGVDKRRRIFLAAGWNTLNI